MNRSAPSYFGALLLASTGLVYCGSSDALTVVPGGSGGSSGDVTTGFGGTSVSGPGGVTVTTTGPGAGDATSGSTTATSATTSSTGAGGAGGSGAGGSNTGGTGVVDAGACPGMQPNNGAPCPAVGEVCDYPAGACTCAPGGMRGRGMGNAWMCVGGGTCPAMPPANGAFCMTMGQVCPYPNLTCTCGGGGGGRGGMSWTCQ